MMMAMHMVENGNINTIVEQRSLGSIGQEFYIYMNWFLPIKDPELA